MLCYLVQTLMSKPQNATSSAVAPTLPVRPELARRLTTNHAAAIVVGTVIILAIVVAGFSYLSQAGRHVSGNEAANSAVRRAHSLRQSI